VDPDLPVADVVTGASIVAESLQQQRFDLVLVIAFAGAALVLAAIGVYGVVAQGVSLRSGELAMRAALGAAPGRLLSHVLGGGAKLAAGGIVAGVALSLGATRLLGSLLFGVGARDAVTYAAVAGLLALVALAASFVPARRAARTDPVAVLRGD
jgi:putative ABC transport system permease protein